MLLKQTGLPFLTLKSKKFNQLKQLIILYSEYFRGNKLISVKFD